MSPENLSRRAILAGAAAVPALALPAVAASDSTNPDPIFAAIDAHRAAVNDINLQEEDDEIDRHADIESEVLGHLLGVTPTSLAGVLGLSRYAAELNGRGYRGLYADDGGELIPANDRTAEECSYFVFRNIESALAAPNLTRRAA
jgi:hypothetical protein